MSRGEKRKFKVHVSRYAKQDKNITAQLFDVLAGLNGWEEAQFKSGVEGAGIDKYIAVHTNNLLNQLLESLRSKESDSHEVLQINKLVEESIILVQRKEFDLALTRLKKAGELARNAELFEKLLEVLFREREIYAQSKGIANYQKYRTEYYAEVKKVINVLDNQVEYFNLLEDIFQIYRTQGGEDPEKLKEAYKNIVSQPLMKDVNLALSTNSKLSFYFVKHVYAIGQRNMSEAENTALQQLELYRKNVDFARAHASQYIYILNNLAIVQAQINDWKAFSATIKEMRSMPNKLSIENQFIRSQIFELSHNEEIDFLLVHNDLDSLKPIISNVEEWIAQKGAESISLNPFLNLAIRLGIYYLRDGRSEPAHHWVKRILNVEHQRTTIHISTYAILLDILLHFQSGDFDYLQYRITNVKKQFRKSGQMDESNELFLNTMKLLLRSDSLEQSEDVIDNYIENLEQLPGSLNKLYYLKFIDIKTFLKNLSNISVRPS